MCCALVPRCAPMERCRCALSASWLCLPDKGGRANPPVPSKVNFDRLWESAFQPAVEEMGYEPVRAGQDLGPLIIQEMLERLYFSDLVIADLTIPNGNVYYEIGIRRSAEERAAY